MSPGGRGKGTPGGRRRRGSPPAIGRDARGVRRRRRDGSGRRSTFTTGATPTGGDALFSHPATPAGSAVTPARGAEDQASWTVRLEDPDACSGCGTCVDVCPRGAIGLNDVAVIDDELCDGCARCVDACPQGALTMEAA